MVGSKLPTSRSDTLTRHALRSAHITFAPDASRLGECSHHVRTDTSFAKIMVTIVVF